MPATKTPLRHTLSRVALGVLAALLVWLFFAFQLFYNVHTPPLHAADAVVMLFALSASMA